MYTNLDIKQITNTVEILTINYLNTLSSRSIVDLDVTFLISCLIDCQGEEREKYEPMFVVLVSRGLALYSHVTTTFDT